MRMRQKTPRTKRPENRIQPMRRKLLPVFFFSILLWLGACNLPQRDHTQHSVTEVPGESEPEHTETPTETPTPLPELEKVVFVTSADTPGITENLNKAGEALCAADYECLTVSSPEEIPSETDFIIFAQEPSELVSLQGKYPEAGFIIVSTPRMKYENAWTIQYDEAFLPFLAGYALESNSSDWRGLGLLPNDSPVWGSHAEEAFLNGGHYMCGNCMPALAPYVSFPLTIAGSGSTAPETWSALIDEAQRSVLRTVFIPEEIMSEALLQKMVSLNVMIMGTTRPPAGYESNWLAAIDLDWAETLRRIMGQIDAGSKAGTAGVFLSITPGYLTETFSEGKANTLRKAYEYLLTGNLSPYSPVNEYSAQ